jgi:hypothetical protein
LSGAIWLGLAGATAQAALTLDELIGILATNGIAFDAPGVQSNAVEAVLRAIDPHACILSAEEADRQARENAGFEDPVMGLAPTAGVVAASAPRRRDAVRPLEYLPRHIAYLKVNGLFENSGGALTDPLLAAATGKVMGVILDLRDAAGSDLDAVVATLSLLYPAGDIAFTLRDNRDQEVTRYAANPAPVFSLPLMVLVNARTADAAELLAAGLKNARGVLVIGAATRGDAALRRAFPLADGRRLRIAVGRLVPARGSDYHGHGVTPDLALAERLAGEAPAAEPPMNTGGKPLSPEALEDQKLLDRIAVDAALRRAADILIGLQALGVETRGSTNHVAR